MLWVYDKVTKKDGLVLAAAGRVRLPSIVRGHQDAQFVADLVVNDPASADVRAGAEAAAVVEDRP